MHSGSCLCGAVVVEVSGDLVPADACHCGQCRKMAGHFWPSTDLPREMVTIRGEDRVAWYRSSAKARRGFCSSCGSTLFWDSDEGSNLSISMGLFDAPTGAVIGRHIFVADKGDYYEISDHLPQYRQSPE